MFDEPTQRPPGSKVLQLIWTYFVNSDGTKNVHCIWNGPPSMNGSVTHTDAHTHTHSSIKPILSSDILRNYHIIYLQYNTHSANDINAFAKASPSKLPLYVNIDAQLKTW